MSVLKRIPLWLVIVVLGLFIAVMLDVLKPTPKPKPAPTQAIAVAMVVKVEPMSLRLPVFTQGTLVPRREIDLVVEVAGKVGAVAPNFVSGAFFKASETLVTIDDANYQLALVRAKAKVADAEQLLATEKGRALQAKREWRDLGNEDANQLFLRKPQLVAAEATVEAAKADVAQAQLDLSRTHIHVPFTGRIRETYVNLGQYLTPGTKVARVFDSEVVEVRLPISDSQAALLDLTLGYHANKGQGPRVILSGVVAGQAVHWLGRVTRTEASLDTKTRMYHAIAEIHKSELRPTDIAPVIGLFVDAEIQGRVIDQVVKLPRSALYKHDQLFVLDTNNAVQIITARVLSKTADEVWVLAPVDAGSFVIVERQGYLKAGLVVQPRERKEL